MTDRRNATWLDWISVAIVLSLLVAIVGVAVGVVATLLHDGPGTGWGIAGGGAIAVTTLFVVAVVSQAIVGDPEPEAGQQSARSGDGVGGRAEE